MNNKGIIKGTGKLPGKRQIILCTKYKKATKMALD